MAQTTKKEILKSVESFLRKIGKRNVSVYSIDKIIEYELDINIAPEPLLNKIIQIESYISRDFLQITIDQGLLDNEVRFSYELASQIAHSELLNHRKIIGNTPLKLKEWPVVVRSLSSATYDMMRTEAKLWAELLFSTNL